MSFNLNGGFNHMYQFIYVQPSWNFCDEAYLILVDDIFTLFLDSVCKHTIDVED